MLFWLTELSDGGDVFNLFRYITFRAGGAFMTALVFGFIFGLPLIGVLRKRQGKGQPIRGDGPEGHFTKAGTPTMGGLLIVGALLFSTLLWARLDNAYVWLVLFVTVAFGAIGFADDYAKVSSNNVAGVPGRVRFGLGLIIAAVAGYWAAQYHPVELQSQLALPVFKNTLINLGIFFVPFSMIVIVGSANAVNLTDGLDGLAIMPVMIASATLGVIAYAVGRVDFTEYLDVHYVPGTGELLIFVAGLIGGGVHPRRDARESGADGLFAGPPLQDLPRHGLDRRDEEGGRRPLQPELLGQARGRGRRGAGALQGSAGRRDLPAHGRAPVGHGLRRRRLAARAARKGVLHPHHARRPAREPRPRHRHHRGADELSADLLTDGGGMGMDPTPASLKTRRPEDGRESNRKGSCGRGGEGSFGVGAGFAGVGI